MVYSHRSTTTWIHRYTSKFIKNYIIATKLKLSRSLSTTCTSVHVIASKSYTFEINDYLVETI